MSADDLYTPTDIDALRMENELLSFEVRFLKARFADPQRAMEEARREVESSTAQLKERLAKAQQTRAKLEEQLAEAKRNRAHLRKRLNEAERLMVPPQRKAQLEQAEKDLIGLLRTMSGGPFGRLLRLKKGFRDLEQRYL